MKINSVRLSKIGRERSARMDVGFAKPCVRPGERRRVLYL